MKTIDNLRVYGLSNSFRVSKFPMSTDIEELDNEITKNIYNLAKAPKGSGHDNFLKGIVVQFDLTFTVKAWTEAERYHWFDIVSSQSTMHRIAKMDFDRCFIEYVTEDTIENLKKLRDAYNADPTTENYLRLLYNCPTGIKLTAGITTNYQQLKTIYSQRYNHRLPEWRQFCEEIKESLSFSKFITGEE